jgi:hypothetical protein
MTEEDFKSINLFYVESFEKMPVKAFLIDSREFAFSVSPELQSWVAEHIISRAIALGLKKLAFMVSKEFIAQLSIEQTIEEGGDIPFQTQYFDELSKAKDWCES